MSLRVFVRTLVLDDPEMIRLGVTDDNLWAAQALDSYQNTGRSDLQDTFGVLRFTGTQPGLSGSRGTGRVRQVTCQMWWYDKQRDFELNIAKILKRWEELMDAQEAPAMGDGAYWIGSDYVGQSDDGWDDVYDRIVRNSAYTIVYTGA